MAPSSPTAPKADPKARVTKSKAEPKKAPQDLTCQEKLYFLWLHLQLKQGNNKINHTAVAAKLNINYKTAFSRFAQMKKQMEKYEESLAAAAEEDNSDSKVDPVKKAFDDLDRIFGEDLR